jgi:hypothetical protein
MMGLKPSKQGIDFNTQHFEELFSLGEQMVAPITRWETNN